MVVAFMRLFCGDFLERQRIYWWQHDAGGVSDGGLNQSRERRYCAFMGSLLHAFKGKILTYTTRSP